MDVGRNGREEGGVLRKFWSERYHYTIEVDMKTELTDSPRHCWVVDVTSTQCICLEFLGGGDFVLPLSRCHKDSF